MSLDTPTTRLNNSRDVANVWITSGTTKLISLKSSSEYTVSTKTGTDSKPGAFTVNQRGSAPLTYSGILPKLFFLFLFFSKTHRSVEFGVKCMKTLYKRSTLGLRCNFYRRRLGQFLAVFRHLACEGILKKYFLHRRPKIFYNRGES